MRSIPAVALALGMLLTISACAPRTTRAVASFTPLGDNTVAGGATFTERDGKTTIRVEARAIAPGQHGVHVHAVGDCSAADGSSAGSHFNPDGGAHGHGSHGNHRQHHGHSGDLGNLEADAGGAGVLLIETDSLTVADGPRSVVGRSIVIHANGDDLTTQPGGGSGDRIGCGVIRRE